MHACAAWALQQKNKGKPGLVVREADAQLEKQVGPAAAACGGSCAAGPRAPPPRPAGNQM